MAYAASRATYLVAPVELEEADGTARPRSLVKFGGLSEDSRKSKAVRQAMKYMKNQGTHAELAMVKACVWLGPGPIPGSGQGESARPRNGLHSGVGSRGPDCGTRQPHLSHIIHIPCNSF